MKTKNSAQINKIPLFDLTGKKVDTVELNKDVFNGKFNNALLYQSILMYRSNLRRGTASTKTRADIRGGGKKPWRQKGTGRARVRSIRNPIWRGGGVVFGPHPRDFRYSLPKKMKRSAFISSLNTKLRDEEISAVENIAIDEPKTKKVAEILKKLNLEEKILILAETFDKNFVLASRNIKNLTLRKASEATSIDVLSNDHILITKDAAEYLNRAAKKRETGA